LYFDEPGESRVLSGNGQGKVAAEFKALVGEWEGVMSGE
jgi:hypothetical protein